MTDYCHMVRNCKDFEEARFEPGYISPKYDGVRAFYYPGQDGLGVLRSRQDKPIYGMSHILSALNDFPHVLDLELIIPGMEFNELSGIIRNHNESPEVRAHIIDSPGQGNIVRRLTRRPQNNLIWTRIPHYWCKNIAQFWKYHRQFLANGLEGSVWKSADHEYTNQRNYHWMREVPIKSEDCEIVDVYEGGGKMSGMLGGFIIDFDGIRCKCGTLKGFDYPKRIEIWQNPEEYIGLVLEVQYKNLQPSGKPRQPRGKGFRYDK